MTDQTSPASADAAAPAAAPSPAPAAAPAPAPVEVAPQHESVLQEIEAKLKEFENASEAFVKSVVEHIKAALAKL